MALRFAARLKRGLTYGADDWMIMFSLFVCFVTGGLSYATIHWGLGSHAITLPLDNITVVLKLLSNLSTALAWDWSSCHYC